MKIYQLVQNTWANRRVGDFKLPRSIGFYAMRELAEVEMNCVIGECAMEENPEDEIMKAKIGSLEAIKESGLLEQVSPGLGDAQVQQEMQIKDEDHQMKIVSAEEKIQMEKAKFVQDAKLKQAKAEQEMDMKREMNDKKMQLAETKVRERKDNG